VTVADLGSLVTVADLVDPIDLGYHVWNFWFIAPKHFKII
jgi:hypothetical protein